MKTPFVAILMGSASDMETMKLSAEVLKNFNIPCELKILSAHRTPEDTLAYVKDADHRGCAVFIAAAGMAAHLAGTVAAHTLKPVIGVPLASGHLQGLDSLLSTVQMPGGIPVACVAVGSAGAKNAGILATQILALHDPHLQKKLLHERHEQRLKIQKANVTLESI